MDALQCFFHHHRQKKFAKILVGFMVCKPYLKDMFSKNVKFVTPQVKQLVKNQTTLTLNCISFFFAFESFITWHFIFIGKQSKTEARKKGKAIPFYFLAWQLRSSRCEATNLLQKFGQKWNYIFRWTYSCTLQVWQISFYLKLIKYYTNLELAQKHSNVKSHIFFILILTVCL